MKAILGTAQLTAPYGVLGESFGTNPDGIREFLQLAELLGFQAIDTAATYPGAEEAIGLTGTTIEIHTKLDPSLDPHRSIRRSLVRLRRSHVEVAYLHDPDAVLAADDKVVSEASKLVGIETDFLGASVYSVEACRAALSHEKIRVVQVPLNPLKRDLLAPISTGRHSEVKVYARSALGQGLLIGDVHKLPERVKHLFPFIADFQKACSSIGRSPIETALLWSRDTPGISGLVLGAASISQLREIATALAQPPLTPDERIVIDDVPQPEPDHFDPRTW